MANKRPEYQEKVILATLLSPVGFMDHMKSPIRFIAPFANQVEVRKVDSNLTFHEFNQ